MILVLCILKNVTERVSVKTVLPALVAVLVTTLIILQIFVLVHYVKMDKTVVYIIINQGLRVLELAQVIYHALHVQIVVSMPINLHSVQVSLM